ncbi:MAG: ABC transporter permease [Bacteroidetes bacterium CG18_big_fil_WC_8_21_14_2_50_41_14]|nr:MAG: ABC transporter permease [Bacteroidetes bacterium CG18_big_fil_WC_8_21_14_2_50_41_14]
MRKLLYILQKEFTQVFRDKAMLPIIFIVPVMQLLVLSYTATFEIKQVRLVVVDHDHTPESRALIAKFSGSSFYKVTDQVEQYDRAADLIKRGKADQFIVIEPQFARNLVIDKKANIQVITDAINGSAASLMSAYAISIISDYNREIIVEMTPSSGHALPISIQPSFWYNPELNYITYMVPGILVLLVTIIGMFLGSMNLVKEKEIGTIEQINVTPIKKYQFIAGKLIPFWVIANVDLAIGLLLAYFVFNIPVIGSVGLLFGVASIYLVAILSIGLVISTLANTMQQAMFISWFFLVIFILMSGLFTPIESMPHWAQILDYANPVAYFIKINRMIMLKGSGWSDIQSEVVILAGYAVLLFTFSIWRYRKTV